MLGEDGQSSASHMGEPFDLGCCMCWFTREMRGIHDSYRSSLSDFLDGRGLRLAGVSNVS